MPESGENLGGNILSVNNEAQLTPSEKELLKLKKEMEDKELLIKLLLQREKPEPPKDASADGFYDEKNPDYHGLSDHLVKKYNILSTNAYSYLYEDGFYRPLHRLEMQSLILEATGEHLKPGHLDNFVKMVLTKSFNKEDLLRPTDGLINLANGILDLKKNKLIPHSRDYFFKYKLPHKYDPKAECPKFKQFLEYIFEDDPECIDVTGELFGYCLLGGPQFLHKSFVLYGSGRNGKSTWLDILYALLGEKNVASVSLANLVKPFSVVNLDGKLANIVEETPNDKINAEAFKTATSGGSLTASHKGKPEYEIRCNARFLFATNKMPNFSETTVGLKERLYFLRFGKFIPEGQRDHGLKPYIIQNEMSGIINLALAGLRDLMARGHLKPLRCHNEVLEEFKIESDSVYDWYTERVTIDRTRDVPTTTQKMYDDYKDYCSTTGRKAVSMISFSMRFMSCVKGDHGKDVADLMHERIWSPGVKSKVRGFRFIAIRTNSLFS